MTNGAAAPPGELAALIEPVARELLGEPNKKLSSKHELRYGQRGSLAVDLRKGTWFDHEVSEGGGVLDLVTRETGLREEQRFEWLREHGYDLEHDARRTNGAGKLGTIVATYDYTDEDGKTLFQVCRFDPKDFRQRKPDSRQHDGWSWSVKGVRNVPYRLVDLNEQLALEHTIFIVEGEKDADNLWKLRVPATCNAGGAGKWREPLNDFFKDADVVVVEDFDPQKKHPKTGELMFHEDGRPILPGQDHAQAVAHALDGTAGRVRLLKLNKFWPEMPLKGDISDWLDKGGGSVERLYDIIERLPDWTPGQQDQPDTAVRLEVINIRAWQGVEPPQRKWIVQDRIPDRNVTLLSGQGGVGKTLLMQQLSVATVLGRDWIGLLPEPGPVLLVTAEDDEDELHFRYDKIARYYGATFNDLADAGLNLMSLAGKDSAMAVADNRGIVKEQPLFAKLKRTAHEIKPRWIVLDTVADIFIVNERDRSQVRQCIALCRGLAIEEKTAVILLAHPSLTGISSGSGLSGSTAWSNSVRSRLYLKTEKSKDKDNDEEAESDAESSDGAARVLETMKSNYAAIGAPIRLVWREGLLIPEPTISNMSGIDRAALEDKARSIFLALLDRYNRQDRVVTFKEKANNFAPKEFANQPEAKDLHKSASQRKRLLRGAMDALLAKERIYIARGPKSAPPSKQTECLYRGGTLI